MRRRSKMRLVPDTTRGIEPHKPRTEELLEIRSQIPGSPIIPSDDKSRPCRIGVKNRRQQIRPETGRDKSPLAPAGAVTGRGNKLPHLGILVGISKKRTKRHRHANRPPGSPRGVVLDSRTGSRAGRPVAEPGSIE